MATKTTKALSLVLQSSNSILRQTTGLFLLTIALLLSNSSIKSVDASTTSSACPFCSAVALTFTEQINSSDITVVAKLVEIPPPFDDPDAEFPKATFEIFRTIKGGKFVGDGKTEDGKPMTFKTQLVGTYPVGQKFLVMGVNPPNVAWSTPMKASDRVFDYLDAIQKLPENGADRLNFFQDYFEDEESVLAFDAYDEFAAAPYQDLIDFKDRMDHAKLVGWIKSPDTSINRRRLYFTMLGVCGTKDDVEMLEGFIESGNRKKMAGLDALIGCYLTLKGEDGVELIEKTFLTDTSSEGYVDTLAAVTALRFHGTEVDVVPRKRIVKAVRQLLNNPKMADMIIPDLARWEDWSLMERLVQMFKDADEDSNWLRVPVITYLHACPKPEAKKYIEELRKIDPEAVERADFFMGFDEEEEDEDGWGEGSPKKEDQEAETDEKKTEPSGSGTPKNVSVTADSAEYVVKKVPLATGIQDQGTFAIETDEFDNEIIRTETSLPGEPELVSTQPVSVTNTPDALSDVESDSDLNPNRSMLVSSTSDSMANPVEAQVAQTVTPQPAVPTAAVSTDITWAIIFVPMGISIVIFLLLWSVVNGWFERLIF